MTLERFKEWLNSLNKKMFILKMKILLILDNVPVYSLDIEMSIIKLLYLPPNTTNKTQPLYLGIIHSFKSLYRNLLNENLLLMDDKNKIKPIDMKECIIIANKAWNLVKKETI